ncbi:MAG: hypothetical protein HKN25_16835 [Pyrinomonadaceae bacterium]|nr:hypothetical protein [Pyrinomonadaceae bacterium]
MLFKSTFIFAALISLLSGLVIAQRPDGQGRRGDRRVPNFERIAERFDANKDGKITREELGERARMLDRFDANNDGVITASDLKNFRAQRRGRRGGGSRGGMFGRFPNARPAPGQIAPNFELMTSDGVTVSLGKLLYEKPVVLEFGSFT